MKEKLTKALKLFKKTNPLVISYHIERQSETHICFLVKSKNTADAIKYCELHRCFVSNENTLIGAYSISVDDIVKMDAFYCDLWAMTNHSNLEFKEL